MIRLAGALLVAGLLVPHLSFAAEDPAIAAKARKLIRFPDEEKIQFRADYRSGDKIYHVYTITAEDKGQVLNREEAVVLKTGSKIELLYRDVVLYGIRQDLKSLANLDGSRPRGLRACRTETFG